MAYKLFDLEVEIMSCDWMLEKVRTNEAYAQNLYAALCNNEFVKNEVMPILKEDTWSCSWRYAGQLIAEIREEGDYLDYYCSGVTNATYDTVQDAKIFHMKLYMPEGQITDEIRADLLKLGWVVYHGDSTA